MSWTFPPKRNDCEPLGGFLNIQECQAYSGMSGTPGNIVCVAPVRCEESDWLLEAMTCLQDDVNLRQAAVGSQYGKAAALRPLLHSD
jgi:hypothetical protein